MSLAERFNRYVGYPGGRRDVTVVETDGNYLVGADGDRYVDLVAGWCVVNAGYGRQRIIAAARDAAEQAAYVTPTYMNEDVVALAETLADITPGDLERSFRVPSGTEAVEMALKAARLHTGQKTIVSNAEAYHGHAFGAMSAGRASMGEPYRPLVPGFTQIRPPTDPDDRWYEMLAETLREEEAAAYITETVLTHHDMAAPPVGHYQRVQEVCEETGTLLILDEVANGFGRTGAMFAADHYDVNPDIMTLAKGLSSGYAPIGAAVMRPEIGDSMVETGKAAYSTFGWTPEAVAAARENIALLQDDALADRARETGVWLAEQVADVDGVADVRQKGMLLGVTVDDVTADAVRDAGVRTGVMVSSTNGDHELLLSPPLNSTKEYLAAGVDRLADAISEAT